MYWLSCGKEIGFSIQVLRIFVDHKSTSVFAQELVICEKNAYG
jgi:hypothetical protein